jgi:hypothetical protein
MFDQKALSDFEKEPKSAYFWILASSYLYYYRPQLKPILSDTTFDLLCKKLLDVRDTVHHSKLGMLISKEDLKAGSLYSLHWRRYPIGLVRMAENLSENKYDSEVLGVDKDLG